MTEKELNLINNNLEEINCIYEKLSRLKYELKVYIESGKIFRVSSYEKGYDHYLEINSDCTEAIRRVLITSYNSMINDLQKRFDEYEFKE